MLPYNNTYSETIAILNDLHVSARWLYTVLGHFRSPYSWTTNPMTTQELADKACLSQRNIYHIIETLEASGLVDVIILKGKKKGKYQFHLKVDERISTELKAELQAKQIALQNGNPKPNIKQVPFDYEHDPNLTYEKNDTKTGD